MFDIDDVDEAKRMLPIYKRADDLLETVSGKKTEQAEQEPLAIADGTFNHNCPLGTPLYAAPVQQADILSKSLKRIQSLERQLKIAQQQWDNSREYALELAERLFKYEEGSPMLLNSEQADQEPIGEVCWKAGLVGSMLDVRMTLPLPPIGTKLYAAPVRTKDLTDDEILPDGYGVVTSYDGLLEFARAVIAADREKNNV